MRIIRRRRGASVGGRVSTRSSNRSYEYPLVQEASSTNVPRMFIGVVRVSNERNAESKPDRDRYELMRAFGSAAFGLQWIA